MRRNKYSHLNFVQQIRRADFCLVKKQQRETTIATNSNKKCIERFARFFVYTNLLRNRKHNESILVLNFFFVRYNH